MSLRKIFIFWSPNDLYQTHIDFLDKDLLYQEHVHASVHKPS